MTHPHGGLIAESLAAPLLGAVGTMTRLGAGRQAAVTAVLAAPRLTVW